MSLSDLGYRFLRVARTHAANLANELQREVTTWAADRERRRGRFPGTEGFFQRDPELEKHFARLELPYGSGSDEARKAWRNLLKKYHPDKHSDDPDQYRVATELTAELTRSYQEIVRAYDEGIL